MQQFKVLAIDDHPEEVDAVKSFLEGREMPVQVVTSADEALSLLRYQASEIFAVLLDFNLPDQKGDEMIGEIYKMNPDTSVVMLSGDADLPA